MRIPAGAPHGADGLRISAIEVLAALAIARIITATWLLYYGTRLMAIWAAFPLLQRGAENIKKQPDAVDRSLIKLLFFYSLPAVSYKNGHAAALSAAAFEISAHTVRDGVCA